MFVQEPERDIVKQFGEEVIEDIMGTFVLYLAVDCEKTNFHSVYGESIRKSYYPPIHVPAVIKWEGETTEADSFGLDKRPKITVFFQERRVKEDLNLMVREGDFVKYGRDIYEIVSLNEDIELFGSFAFKVEIIASCIKARPDVADSQSPIWRQAGQ
jgi:hypothetical protein